MMVRMPVSSSCLLFRISVYAEINRPRRVSRVDVSMSTPSRYFLDVRHYFFREQPEIPLGLLDRHAGVSEHAEERGISDFRMQIDDLVQATVAACPRHEGRQRSRSSSARRDFSMCRETCRNIRSPLWISCAGRNHSGRARSGSIRRCICGRVRARAPDLHRRKPTPPTAAAAPDGRAASRTRHCTCGYPRPCRPRAFAG